MFTLAAYLGARLPGSMGGLPGTSIALCAIFLPGFLLIAGIFPLWSAIAGRQLAARAIAGVNAAVVGLLAAALYDPVWTSAVQGPVDVAIAVIGVSRCSSPGACRALLVVVWCVVASIGASFL